MSKKHTLPRFRSEDEEREFWSRKDSTTYVNWEEARRVILPNLKPTQKTMKRLDQELRGFDSDSAKAWEVNEPK